MGIASLYGLNETEQKQFKPSDADVWIVDGNRVAKLERPFLTQLLQRERVDDSASLSWKVLMNDFSDRFQFQLRKYQKLNIWDKPHIRIAVRSIVQGRHFDSDEITIVQGKIAPNLRTAGGPMLHSPYAVRSDIVSTIQSILGTNSTTLLQRELDMVSRPMDVLHMWQISFREGKSKLRNEVSKLVRSWNGTRMTGDRKMKTSIDEVGPRRMIGRNSVNVGYVQAMMSSKIVVVTQKDDWEDHYRLMEALVCGPLVVANLMLVPPQGLMHGENIVFF